MTILSFAETCRRADRPAPLSNGLPPKQPGSERVLPLPSSLPARPAPEREGGLFFHGEALHAPVPGLWRPMMNRWLDGAEADTAACRPVAIGA